MNPNPQTVALVSLGCAKNAVDLQIRAGKLIKQGFALSPDPDRADLCIVNTCAFIESAREEAEAEIVRALELKHRGNYGKVVVTGCYPKRYPKARGKFPGVDGWEGVPDRWEEPPVPGLRFTGKAFAYLKIAEGCAHRCAYCAIPAIRGKYRSRPPESILAEAKTLLATGCRELNIVAQDPMLYGCDLKGRKTRLTDLCGDSTSSRAISGCAYSTPTRAKSPRNLSVGSSTRAMRRGTWTYRCSIRCRRCWRRWAAKAPSRPRALRPICCAIWCRALRCAPPS